MMMAYFLAAANGFARAEPASPRGWLEGAFGRSILQAQLANTVFRADLDGTYRYDWPWSLDLTAGLHIGPRFGIGIQPWLRIDAGSPGGAGVWGIGAVAEYRIDSLTISARGGYGAALLCCGFGGDSDGKAAASTFPVGLSAGYFVQGLGFSVDAMTSTVIFDRRWEASFDRWLMLGVSIHVRGNIL